MIVDSMSKTEVMRSIRAEFDAYCYPVFLSNLRRYRDIGLKQIGVSNRTINKTLFYPTPNGLKFELQLAINKKGYRSQFYLTFHWRNRTCFAVLTDNKAVDVFQSHALERYSERHLDITKSENKGVFESITHKMDNCFSIILPTPTHPLSHYLVIGGALFLGDFDPGISDRFFWHNTCISQQQMGRSQFYIVRLLNELASSLNNLGFNPFLSKKSKDENLTITKEYLKKYPQYSNELVDLLKREYLLLSLVDSDEFNVPDSLAKDTHSDIDNLEALLVSFNINTSDYLKSNRQLIGQIISEIAYIGEEIRIS